MTLGERLKLIQQKSGLNLPDFAKKIGVSKESLINYQKDRTKPDGAILATICNVFKASPFWLLLGKDDPNWEGDKTEINQGSSIAEDLLREIVTAVEEWLSRRGLSLAPARKADLIIILYNHFNKEGGQVDKDTVGRFFLQLVA